MPVLDQKANTVFAGKVVRKVKVGANVPVYVVEYLLGKYCATDDPYAIEPGIALLIAVYRVVQKREVLPALLILGDVSIQGNIKPVRSLAEPLQVGMDNGARRALIPLENKRNFLDVSADIIERVDPVFYGDPMTAALKALSMH